MDTCGINIGKDCENLIMDYVNQLEHVDKMRKSLEKINCYGALMRYYEEKGDIRMFSDNPLVYTLYVKKFVAISIMGRYYINIRRINDSEYNKDLITCQFVIEDVINGVLDVLDGIIY